MSGSGNLREAKEKAVERILLGAALAAVAGYVALAFAILRREKPRR